jgi:hypothetical protein
MRGGGQLLIWVVLFLLLRGSKNLAWSLSTSACAEETSECIKLSQEYPRLELTLVGLNAEKYMAFNQELRNRLAGSVCHGVQVCRSSNDVPPQDPGRFILVDITNLAGEIATLALDVTNVYLVGYRVGNSSFFFRPDDADTRAALHYLFEGTSRFDLHCTARYGDIGNIARLPPESELAEIRLYIELGPSALDRAITSMNRYARRRTPLILHAVARGLIVCIQMVSEAARFRTIETSMSSRIESDIDYPLGHSIVGLENQWRPMSEALQRTTNGAVLANLTL